MPCNSDYMQPTQKEINSVHVISLLDEAGLLNKEDYNKTYGDVQKLDYHVSLLCSHLQEVDVKKYSLEMQIWHRDHVKADKERVENEVKQANTEKEKQVALSKLTDYEKKLLGINK